ncbi:MAG: hypothetical protein WCK55_16810 [Verrucomicrobiota bacterium]
MKFEPQMNADEEAMISPLKHPCRHPASFFAHPSFHFPSAEICVHLRFPRMNRLH